MQRAEIEATAASCLPDRVVEPQLRLPPEDIAGLDPILGHLIDDFLELVDRHGGVRRAHMDDPSRLLAVKGGEPVNRLCAKEGRNGVEVGGKSVVFRLSLPALSLIGAEVLYLEGPAVRDAQESLTLTGGLDRESIQEARLTSKKGASWAPVPAVPTVHVWRPSPVVLFDEERPTSLWGA